MADVVLLDIAAADILRVARGELGVRESPPGSNRVKYGAAYGMDGQPWCAMFVWWVYSSAGVDLREALLPTLAWTPAFATACARAGWPAVEPAQARAGDLVFYDFPDSTPRIQHVGIVDRRSGTDSLVAIEGNTSVTSQDNGGAVMRRWRPHRYVAAVYRPAYGGPDQATQPDGGGTRSRRPSLIPVSVVEAIMGRLPVLNRGDKGVHVRRVQALVNVQGAAPKLATDGDFGPKTAREIRQFQDRRHIAVDAIVGPVTWSELLGVA